MKKLVFFVIIIIAAAGIFYYFSRPAKPDKKTEGRSAPETKEEEIAAKPWIEVLGPTTSLKSVDGVWTEADTGDEIVSGAAVKTSATGLAIIHLPDGSALSLDSGSEITVNEVYFDVGTETLKVKATLALGRVWSKIVELATPESSWEVKTQNAVAAVRGTAFGMELAGDGANILVSENTVTVQAIDFLTGEIVPDNSAEVAAGKTLSIRRPQLASLKTRRILLAQEVKLSGTGAFNRPWAARAVKADKILNEKIKNWENQGWTRPAIRRALRREIFEQRRRFLLERARMLNGGALSDTGENDTGEKMPSSQELNSAGAGVDGASGLTAPSDSATSSADIAPDYNVSGAGAPANDTAAAGPADDTADAAGADASPTNTAAGAAPTSTPTSTPTTTLILNPIMPLKLTNPIVGGR